MVIFSVRSHVNICASQMAVCVTGWDVGAGRTCEENSWALLGLVNIRYSNKAAERGGIVLIQFT